MLFININQKSNNSAILDISSGVTYSLTAYCPLVALVNLKQRILVLLSFSLKVLSFGPSPIVKHNVQ